MRDNTPSVNIGLVLVVVVVVVAVAGGRLPGAVAAVTAAVAFDFFYTRPYLRLTIDSRDDVETTVLLLVVGLVGRARRDATAGGRGGAKTCAAGRSGASTGSRRWERGVGRRPTSSTRRGPSSSPCSTCARAASTRPRSSATTNGSSAAASCRGATTGCSADGFELPAAGVELLVMGRGRLLGRFVLDPTPGTGVSLEQRVVAVALADQVGAVLAAPAAERT